MDDFKPYKSYLLLLLCVFVTISVAFFIFLQIKSLFKLSLQERVKSIAEAAALNFDVKDLDQIRGRESVSSSIYKKIIFSMQALRSQNPSLRFIDIYRKTSHPTLFEYVADADSLHPNIPIDLNGDGKIDSADALNYPGDIYDGSSVPNFVQNAFVKSDVDDNLEVSQWGATLDASSPIFDRNGKANYVLNVDVDVTEFVRQTNMAFIPFWIFIFILVIILTLLTISIVRIWKSRVEFFRELDRQKDELLGIVSHQLATPVTSIKWYLEMLQSGDLGALPANQKEHVGTMQSITTSLADLIAMILDVSRIQLGRVKIAKQDLDLNDFFKEILAIIVPKAKEKQVDLQISMPEKLPVAMLDKRYTRMTVENLLTNAVKYTPPGGKVNFTVQVRGNTLYCEVRDTGLGIPKAEQTKVFEKLYRATNVRNTVEGNGFGLYVAKGAIEAQGGKIWFESEEGKGTNFFIELPLK